MNIELKERSRDDLLEIIAAKDMKITMQKIEIKEMQKEIERLKKLLDIEKNKRKLFDKDNQKLHSIIKEVREILKYHLSNPSGTKNGWHIDIWNSENINKLNELLEILKGSDEISK